MAGSVAKALKQTTGLTGLAVNKYPHETLKILYDKLLTTLEKMPENAAYRQNTEQIVKTRLSLVNSEPNIEKLEEKINDGMIEQVINQARRELSLSRQMLNWQPWEPLVEEAPKDQWKWPIN